MKISSVTKNVSSQSIGAIGVKVGELVFMLSGFIGRNQNTFFEKFLLS